VIYYENLKIISNEFEKGMQHTSEFVSSNFSVNLLSFQELVTILFNRD